MTDLAQTLALLDHASTPAVLVVAYLLWRLDRRLIEVETALKSVFRGKA